MDAVLEWGLDVVRAVQAAESPALTAAMKAITTLGTEAAYLVLIVIVYWCLDEKKGIRIASACLLSAWVNGALKDLWKQPRPYDLDPALERAREKTFGLPSGHAQGSLTFWGIAASWKPTPLSVGAAAVLVLAIAYTRLYLGVHFPTDILGGWILGGAVLGLYFAFGEPLARAFGALDLRFRILLAALAAFGMNGLHPGSENIGGAFFGAAVGYQLMKERFPFSAAAAADGGRPTLAVLALRFAVGMAGVALAYGGLKLVFPGPDSPWYALFRFLRYGLLAAWTTAGAPWVFLRLKLAGAR